MWCVMLFNLHSCILCSRLFGLRLGSGGTFQTHTTNTGH